VEFKSQWNISSLYRGFHRQHFEFLKVRSRIKPVHLPEKLEYVRWYKQFFGQSRSRNKVQKLIFDDITGCNLSQTTDGHIGGDLFVV
jgi:hypothetical protein